MRLKDKVALVTGGGSGIGRAIALRFGREGARVVVNDVNAEAARKTAAEIGGGARGVQADVSDSTQVKAMFAEVDGAFGTLDILVNNAGIAYTPDDRRADLTARSEARVMEMLSGRGVQTHWDVTQEMTDASWHRMIGVHLNGTFFCTREALRIMAHHNRGAIVNLSSVAGLMGLEQVPHYSAAKGGILSFTRAVAREVASRNIRVNAICPGYIETPMTEGMSPLIRAVVLGRTPLNRNGSPEEIAATALFLVSDDGAFYTGQWLSPNGGLFMG